MAADSDSALLRHLRDIHVVNNGERIRQLEKAALRKLRKPSRARMLVGALD